MYLKVFTKEELTTHKQFKKKKKIQQNKEGKSTKNEK